MLKLLSIVLAVGLMLVGMVFLVASGAGNTGPRLVIGVIMMLAGGLLVILVRKSARQEGASLTQKIDLSGDVHLEDMSCRKCGGSLSAENVSVKAGAVFISCPYCKAEYQVEEKPRW